MVGEHHRLAFKMASLSRENGIQSSRLDDKVWYSASVIDAGGSRFLGVVAPSNEWKLEAAVDGYRCCCRAIGSVAV